VRIEALQVGNEAAFRTRPFGNWISISVVGLGVPPPVLDRNVEILT
jgi:hypothetical protein